LFKKDCFTCSRASLTAASILAGFAIGGRSTTSVRMCAIIHSNYTKILNKQKKNKMKKKTIYKKKKKHKKKKQNKVLNQKKKKVNQKPVEKEEVEIKSLRLKHITQKKNYSINGKNCL